MTSVGELVERIQNAEGPTGSTWGGIVSVPGFEVETTHTHKKSEDERAHFPTLTAPIFSPITIVWFPALCIGVVGERDNSKPWLFAADSWEEAFHTARRIALGACRAVEKDAIRRGGIEAQKRGWFL